MGTAVFTTRVFESFGVELELVFAFESTELEKVLRQRGYSPSAIVKKIRRFDRQVLHPISGKPDFDPSRPLYRSWGIKPRIDHHLSPTYTQIPDFYKTITSGSTSLVIRPYWSEPLEIASRVLLRQDPPLLSTVDNTKKTRTSHIPQGTWVLQNDISIVPPDPKDLRLRIAEKQDAVSPTAYKEWDSYGIELISPVLRCESTQSLNQSLSTVTEYLTALRGDVQSTWTAIPSKYAGLHVHTGINPDVSDVEALRILQHLAYITTTYEEVLVSLVAPHRDAFISSLTEYDTMSNLESLARAPLEMLGPAQPPDLTTRSDKAPGSFGGNAMSSSGWHTKYSLSLLRAKLFHPSHQDLRSLVFILHGPKIRLAQEAKSPEPTCDISLELPNDFRPCSEDERIGLGSVKATIRDRTRNVGFHGGYLVNYTPILESWQRKWQETFAEKFGVDQIKTENSNQVISKRTIEWRAHQSTTNPLDVKMWVQLVLAICRTAERMASSSSSSLDTDWAARNIDITEKKPGMSEAQWQAQRYPPREYPARKGDSPDELFDLIGLQGELRAYWTGKWEFWKEHPEPELSSAKFAPNDWPKDVSDEDEED
ncbi:MAG: hypothetical protein Q9227_001398 [Pyrenula ochraceoflavens]